MIYRGYEVGDDEETEGKKAGVDALWRDHETQLERLPYHKTTRGRCEHSLIFNYAGGKSACGECAVEFIKTKKGQRLNIDALEDMYEALKYAEKTLRQNGIVPVLVIKALAKAEGQV